MLYKSTLKLLVVETETKELLVPIVTNSYKKTLWLLKHREPSAKAIGIIEGAFHDINYMHVGEINIPTLHSQVIRTTNAIYTAIGNQPTLPNCFILDYNLTLDEFIMAYTNIYTPDELLVILGIGHNKLFRTIGRMVAANEITYVPENGPGKWSYYDYYWLNEKYKGGAPRALDIKPFINRPNPQIKLRAHLVGFTTKVPKKNISNINVTINTEVVKDTVTLSEVQRDYMISQISDIIFNIINKGDVDDRA